MQFIEQYADKGEFIPWPVCRAITLQLAETVHYCHNVKVALGSLHADRVVVTGLTRGEGGEWAVGEPETLCIKVGQAHQHRVMTARANTPTVRNCSSEMVADLCMCVCIRVCVCA